MEDNLGEPQVHVPNVLPTHPTFMLDSDFIPSDNSLPESEIFYFNIEEKNSGSTTIHVGISLPDLECFYFKSEPDLGELISIVGSGIRENVLSATNVNLSPEEDHSSLLAYVVLDIQKKDKNEAKTDKTRHEMEKRKKSKSTKSKPTKVKVKDGAETKEMLNGLTRTHLIGRTRKDYGMRRGRHSTSSSSVFGQPSSSHLNDDDDDGNDEGTSCVSTSSTTHFVNSLPNEVPRVFENPPNINPNMESFYSRQTKILNRQLQLRDEQRGGTRSIGKGIRNLLMGKKKK
uniref:Uncharacterized protein n=1 Tax=Tanacetum cinerariifolium TaxID=118510 RepID=A0A6L2NH61_TANCI|nr:hypothetical protein [Tanacetum cinerariifolium]